MPSLNEIKTRIGSVNSTKKITSAMMMIASAKLNRAQGAITNFLPYQQKLGEILANILASDLSFDSPFTVKREVKRTAIIACSSNSSLCGAFNSNIIKSFMNIYTQKRNAVGEENILVFPVGKKISEAVTKRGIKVEENLNSIANKPSFEEAQQLAEKIINLYLTKQVDEVILVYTHFVSTGTQRLVTSHYLPFVVDDVKAKEDSKLSETDYIFEPTKQEILDNLIPLVLYSKLFSVFLDSHASEHAGRIIAMQTATDNAKNLNEELTIQYNKQRQQAVTNQLLDIIGGANAIQ